MTTTGSFMVGAQEYVGVATLELPIRQWYCYIVKDGEWYKGVGYFHSVPQCWRAVERALGIEDTREGVGYEYTVKG